MTHPLWVVHELDVVSVALAEFETNAPTVIDRHSPLAPPIALGLVKANAFQWTKIAERLSNVESEQKINGGFEIQSSKMIRTLAVPDLPGRRMPPRLDHG